MIETLQDQAKSSEQSALTTRQREILEFIQTYLDDNGYPPTVRDIGGAVGLTSSSTVHAHLSNLEKAGAIRRDPTKPRALEILVDGASSRVKRAMEATQRATERVSEKVSGMGLPLLGAVAAGGPILAEENIEEYIDIPRIAGGNDADFVLSVRGDSMMKAGILDGDFVVVKSAQTARDGEIVVAMIENEATVKRFFREADHIRLQPENDAYEPIRSPDAAVIGSVVGVFRRVM
jgi:repressor LexA